MSEIAYPIKNLLISDIDSRSNFLTFGRGRYSRAVGIDKYIFWGQNTRHLFKRGSSLRAYGNSKNNNLFVNYSDFKLIIYFNSS